MELRLNLTEEERQLLASLLERERLDLHPDLRRSNMSPDAHAQLRSRLELVERLLALLTPIEEKV